MRAPRLSGALYNDATGRVYDAPGEVAALDGARGGETQRVAVVADAQLRPARLLAAALEARQLVPGIHLRTLSPRHRRTRCTLDC